MPNTLPACNDQCAVFNFTFKPQYPIVTLGKCLKWDTVKNAEGKYEAPEGSNVSVLVDFIKDHGKLLWTSECHGVTVVCMDSVCQLSSALKHHKDVLKGAKGFEGEGHGD